MTLVHTDARGRLSLGKLVQADRDYRVSTSPHGTVTLEPVTVVSDYERSLLANPSLVAALTAATSAVDRGELTAIEYQPRDLAN